MQELHRAIATCHAKAESKRGFHIIPPNMLLVWCIILLLMPPVDVLQHNSFSLLHTKDEDSCDLLHLLVESWPQQHLPSLSNSKFRHASTGSGLWTGPPRTEGKKTCGKDVAKHVDQKLRSKGNTSYSNQLHCNAGVAFMSTVIGEYLKPALQENDKTSRWWQLCVSKEKKMLTHFKRGFWFFIGQIKPPSLLQMIHLQ